MIGQIIVGQCPSIDTRVTFGTLIGATSHVEESHTVRNPMQTMSLHDRLARSRSGMTLILCEKVWAHYPDEKARLLEIKPGTIVLLLNVINAKVSNGFAPFIDFTIIVPYRGVMIITQLLPYAAYDKQYGFPRYIRVVE